jgi:hypothetical protein
VKSGCHFRKIILFSEFFVAVLFLFSFSLALGFFIGLLLWGLYYDHGGMVFGIFMQG